MKTEARTVPEFLGIRRHGPAWLLPLAALAGLPWQPASAQHLIGDEIAVVKQTDGQFSSAVASNGSGYLVVWRDDRSGEPDIYGQRVTVSGEPVGDRIIVNDHEGDQQLPAVVSDGSGYLVVWQDDRNGNADIYGQRMTAEGLRSGDPFVISSHDDEQTAPAVAWNGSGYLVVWEDSRDGGDIYGQRLTEEEELAGGAFRISADDGSETGDPAVAFGDGGYLVVWEQQTLSDIHGRLVSSAGALQGDEIAVTDDGDDQYSPALTSDGSGYLVAWQDHRNGNGDVFALRLAADGSPQGDEIQVCTQDDDQLSPGVAWSGNGYTLVWQDSRNGDRDIYGHELAADGSLLGGQFVVTSYSGDQWTPSIASDGTAFLAVWDDERDSGGYDVYGQLIGSDNLIDLPADRQWFSYTAPAAPVLDKDAGDAMPIAFGDLADELAAQADLLGFNGEVDIYLAYYSAALDADHFQFVTADGTVAVPRAGFSPASISESLRLRDTGAGPLSWSMAGIPLENLPAGDYQAFLGVTPHGVTDSFYIWRTGFTLP